MDCVQCQHYLQWYEAVVDDRSQRPQLPAIELHPWVVAANLGQQEGQRLALQHESCKAHEEHIAYGPIGALQLAEAAALAYALHDSRQAMHLRRNVPHCGECRCYIPQHTCQRC